ncbi:MAG TPA: type II secretion system F family protein [Streptosporangiaceae bacterium]|nr:type II secretion system F family protein [Streptosporangiaceae bacterium]
MNLWVIAAGVLAGLGVFALVRELIPPTTRLDAALNRLNPAADFLGAPVWAGSADLAAAPGMTGATGGASGAFHRVGEQLAAAAPWLPVPVTDLSLLGKDRGSWLASKIAWGLAGLIAAPLLAALLAFDGVSLPLPVPVFASLALGVCLFFAPDLNTRVSAQRHRSDFRYALASYLDLVALERGAGAGPTEALEAAAEIGGGWAFQRIRTALDNSRRAGQAPWTGLADLAAETGVVELADLADIAEVAGQEGAKILQTLAARAESMRAQALSADRASANSKSTTMVVPIALLGAGFLILLVFPMVYRILGTG